MSLDTIDQMGPRSQSRHGDSGEKRYHDRVTTAEQEEMLMSSFQRLSLAIPREPANFAFITLFLSRVLNLNNPDTLIRADPVHQFTTAPPAGRPTEVVPNIAVPADLWLVDNIQIKNVKIKTTMLAEINGILGINKDQNSALDSDNSRLQKDSPLVDDNTLLYYEKLLAAYKVYEVPNRYSITSMSPVSASSTASPISSGPPHARVDFPLKEEDNEEDADHDDTKLANTTSSQSSNGSLKTAETPTHSSTKRVSGFGQRKRFLALMGQGHKGDEQGTTVSSQPSPQLSLASPHTTQVSGNEEENKRQQALNSMLAKSRIYNKIKRHRESGSSFTSATSSGLSSRNSVSTTTTVLSGSSRRRSSASYGASTDGEMRSMAAPYLGMPLSPIPLLAPQQKSENRRAKYEYYVQLQDLLQTTEKVLAMAMASPGGDGGVTRFVEFIRKRVLRFIIIDVFQMIMDYGQLKAYELFGR